MNVNAAAQSQSTSQKSLTGTGGEDTTQTFLTLLMTQLKTQDPFSPMDPTQMVTQLTQFNSLSELMQIRQLLQDQVAGAAATDKTGAQTGVGGQ
jgi:flagellar basal-body rod modification protein FlgD